MIITVLWEDQRGVEAKGFGPHELLVACLCDELGLAREALGERVASHPLKGNGNVLRALQKNLGRLRNSGPVIAVVDRDKVHVMWPTTPPPPTCTSGKVTRFRQDAPGSYDLVLFERNTETLVTAVCTILGRDIPADKPRPDQRDRLLMPAVWSGAPVRLAIRQACPSFDRIVTRAAGHLRPSFGP